MYKVFVNDKPIILSDQAISDSEYEIYLFKNTRLEEIIHKLQNTLCPGIFLYHTDLDELWEKFKNFFEIVPAAGGLVANIQNELLFIRRNERWDLPKGRMEKGETSRETAIREVEEECGITKLEITDELPVSYHVYQEFNQNKLKKTYWFLMKTTALEKPVPQREEGIVIAEFVAQDKLCNYYSEMYANISEIVCNYLNKR